MICAATWRALSRSWTAAATTKLDEVYAFLRADRWRARSRSWTAAANTLLDEVYAFLLDTRWRARSRSWTAAANTLLDEVYAFLRAARWRQRARNRSWTAAANTLLDEVYYPTTDRASDFGPGPEAVLEGRAAKPGICFFASLTDHFGPSPAGRRRGAQLDGSLHSTPPSANFGPGQEGAADGLPTRRGSALHRLS